MLAHVSISLKCEGISCETTSFVSIQTRMPSVKTTVNPSSRCCDMESQGCFTNTQKGKKNMLPGIDAPRYVDDSGVF